MSRDLYAPAQLVDDQPIVNAPTRSDHYNPLRVEDTNPFATGAQFHGTSEDGSPVEFSVRLPCSVDFNAYPAPSLLRGVAGIAGNGVIQPSQEWAKGEYIALYRDAVQVAKVKENSGITRADLTPGVYVVASSAKLPFAFHIKAFPPAGRV